MKKLMLLTAFALASSPCAHAITDGFFSAAVLNKALLEQAPDWNYSYQNLTFERKEAFALYTLAAEAYASPINRSEIDQEIADRIISALTGGHEPESQGGLGGWSHGAFAWTLAYAKKTDAVWSKLTTTQKARADVVMKAMAVAANFTLDDENDYKCMLDGDKNWSKVWNPNHVEGYVGVALAADWYFGTTALNNFFQTFDFDTFIAQVNSFGFTNIYSCWTRTPNTKSALMNGGAFDSGDSSYGTGAGVHNNTFEYKTFTLDKAWSIYDKLAIRMYAHVAQTEIPITGKSETTYLLETIGGVRTISPWDGKTGMCYEFLTTNAPTNGSNFRSSLSYVYDGWMNNLATATALYLRGYWAGAPTANKIWTRMNVGSEDFIFKAQKGYSGFSSGYRNNQYDTNLLPIGYDYPFAWWNDLMSGIYADTFNSLTGWGTGSTDFTTTLEIDTANVFGQGTDNTYMKLVATSSTNAHLRTHAITGLGNTGQISFSFYDPQATGGGNGFIFRFGTGNANSSTAFALFIRRGSIMTATGNSVALGTSIGSYSFNAPHTLTVVFNNSSAALSYANGTKTVSSGTMHVWLDGVHIQSMVASNNSGLLGSSVTSLNFNDKTGFYGTLYIDNLTTDNRVSIGSYQY